MLALEADLDDTETLNMSRKEMNRLEILGRVLERRLTQAEAAYTLAAWFSMRYTRSRGERSISCIRSTLVIGTP